mgnify:CR=1 FL=1
MTAKGFAVLTVVVVAVLAVGCGQDFGNRGDREQVKRQQALSDQANQQIGLPGITNFTERKLVRKLYELRDQNVATFTYVVDFQGQLWHLCDSLGYGLPYGVQFTNPERPAWASETQEAGNITLPQAEPNGLFMPPSAEGSWVICIGKDAEDFQPVYSEPRVIVSPFRLKSVGDYLPE